MEREQYIFYGAGKMGLACWQFMERHGLGDCISAFCDKNWEKIKKLGTKEVISYEAAKAKTLPFVLCVDKKYVNEVVTALDGEGIRYYSGLDRVVVNRLNIMKRGEFEREFCAISHEESMDQYFDSAEEDDSLNPFWEEKSIFRRMFDKLDLTNVVELACGRGRHVCKYIDKADRITLVDILEKNIAFCKKRFSAYQKIDFVTNNGYDLCGLKDESYTALFTYDAMVHFELLDIANYLSETYRILRKGGMALFHHSNNDSDYKASYADAIYSRSFMSKTIFAYLAYRAGFEIVEQEVIPCNGVDGLDCLTLVIKK